MPRVEETFKMSKIAFLRDPAKFLSSLRPHFRHGRIALLTTRGSKTTLSGDYTTWHRLLVGLHAGLMEKMVLPALDGNHVERLEQARSLANKGTSPIRFFNELSPDQFRKSAAACRNQMDVYLTMVDCYVTGKISTPPPLPPKLSGDVNPFRFAMSCYRLGALPGEEVQWVADPDGTRWRFDESAMDFFQFSLSNDGSRHLQLRADSLEKPVLVFLSTSQGERRTVVVRLERHQGDFLLSQRMRLEEKKKVYHGVLLRGSSGTYSIQAPAKGLALCLGLDPSTTTPVELGLALASQICLRGGGSRLKKVNPEKVNPKKVLIRELLTHEEHSAKRVEEGKFLNTFLLFSPEEADSPPIRDTKTSVLNRKGTSYTLPSELGELALPFSIESQETDPTRDLLARDDDRDIFSSPLLSIRFERSSASLEGNFPLAGFNVAIEMTIFDGDALSRGAKMIWHQMEGAMNIAPWAV